MQKHHYRQRLQAELSQRAERNTRYSLRAFAQSLAIDAGTLSRLLSGKQIPSLKMAQKISAGLGLSPKEKEDFFSSLAHEQTSRPLQRLNPAFRDPPPQDLRIELYRVIADWYHVAILELSYVEGFKPEPRWIASELGISPLEAKLATERLLEFGLLEKHKKTLKKSSAQLSTADKETTTQALRKNQRQFLELALHSLENDPIEERAITSMTMAIDPAKIPLARKAISDFNRSLCALLESGKRKRVYNLQVALYPIQKKPKKSKETL